MDGSALYLTTVAHEAEGYVAADLNDLVENAMQQALVRQMTGDAVRAVGETSTKTDRLAVRNL